MRDYQPQWVTSEKIGDGTQHATDRTDSFEMQGQIVSSVSAPSGQLREVVPPQTHPADAGNRDTAAALLPELEAGWRWLASQPNHPEHEPFLARWLERLREYERTYAATHRMETMDLCHS
jgi:hypothetical protein